MNHCCHIFEDLCSNAGRRGLSVIVASAIGDGFLLQCRAIDSGEDPTLIVSQPDVPLTITEQLAIFHCPGCGTTLSKYYRKHLDDLRRDDLHIQAF